MSLINDLPLFIDPFLLFNSDKPEYRELHDRIIEYLVFLRDRAAVKSLSEAQLKLWYCFPEVRQNWLGFSLVGNGGSGLGMDFARALHTNLHHVFSDFSKEKVTEGTHLEKLCLISEGVGRDNISDFTTNLIKDYLCQYTAGFASQHISNDKLRVVAVHKARFNYTTESWETARYRLPAVRGDYVILTPKDMLTRDDNWISRRDLIDSFLDIPPALPDAQLRAQVSHYFHSMLAKHRDREASKKEQRDAAAATLKKFPELVDYYILLKERQGSEAESISAEKVAATEQVFVRQLRALQEALASTNFYGAAATTYKETHARLAYFKDVIENKGGHRIFYLNGKAIEREKDVQILYRLVWFGTPSDVSAEVNDGRGPADFKISRGQPDKTIVEIKLAKNTQIERNLEKQAELYQRASDAKRAIKVVVFFSADEERRVQGILKKLGMADNRDVVLIDARDDNKPSASRA